MDPEKHEDQNYLWKDRYFAGGDGDSDSESDDSGSDSGSNDSDDDHTSETNNDTSSSSEESAEGAGPHPTTLTDAVQQANIGETSATASSTTPLAAPAQFQETTYFFAPGPSNQPMPWPHGLPLPDTMEQPKPRMSRGFSAPASSSSGSLGAPLSSLSSSSSSSTTAFSVASSSVAVSPSVSLAAPPPHAQPRPRPSLDRRLTLPLASLARPPKRDAKEEPEADQAAKKQKMDYTLQYYKQGGESKSRESDDDFGRAGAGATGV